MNNENTTSLPVGDFKLADLIAMAVEEHYGWVWVFLGDLPAEQRPPIPEFPEYHDTANWRCIRGEWDWDADQARVIENGLDFAHADRRGQ